MITSVYREGSRVHLPGGSIMLVRHGTGPPVLLVHGIPLSLISWRYNIDHLARSSTILAVDLRGFGLSDKPLDADYSVLAQAHLMEELMDRMEFPSFSIVGSSYGCAVALTLADIVPNRVDKLVLINPVCYPRGRHSATRLARLGIVAALASPVLRSPALGRRMMARSLQRSYTQVGLATPELIGAYHELLTRESGERCYLAALRQLNEAEVARRVPQVMQESLIIWGMRDRVLPVKDAYRLAAELPTSRLELLPSAGHFPHEENPERLNPLIAGFLADVPNSGARLPRTYGKGVTRC